MKQMFTIGQAGMVLAVVALAGCQNGQRLKSPAGGYGQPPLSRNAGANNGPAYNSPAPIATPAANIQPGTGGNAFTPTSGSSLIPTNSGTAGGLNTNSNLGQMTPNDFDYRSRPLNSGAPSGVFPAGSASPNYNQPLGNSSFPTANPAPGGASNNIRTTVPGDPFDTMPPMPPPAGPGVLGN